MLQLFYMETIFHSQMNNFINFWISCCETRVLLKKILSIAQNLKINLNASLMAVILFQKIALIISYL